MPEGRLPPSVFLEIACGPTACNLFILCHVGTIELQRISGTSPPSIASNKFRYFSRLSVSGRLAGLTLGFLLCFGAGRPSPWVPRGTLHAPMGCLL